MCVFLCVQVHVFVRVCFQTYVSSNLNLLEGQPQACSSGMAHLVSETVLTLAQSTLIRLDRLGSKPQAGISLPQPL